MTTLQSERPSRRGFLAITAGAAVTVPTMAIAAPADSLRGPYSPELTDASLALQAAHDAALAAKAAYREACDKADQWERDNPEPKSRKGIKRWLRKARVVSDRLTRPAFVDLIGAEKVFTDAQIAFAKIPPRNERELRIMACHAVIFDNVRLTERINRAPISQVVAYYLLKFQLPGMNDASA